MLIPVVIGVSGHRDLRAGDESPLRAAVRQAFVRIGDMVGDGPVIVLSALAEGSDRLTAEVGIELGHALVVPLPMPPPLYRSDFRDEESVKQFDRLLACATSVHTLPPNGRAGASWGDVDPAQFGTHEKRAQ